MNILVEIQYNQNKMQEHFLQFQLNHPLNQRLKSILLIVNEQPLDLLTQFCNMTELNMESDGQEKLTRLREIFGMQDGERNYNQKQLNNFMIILAQRLCKHLPPYQISFLQKNQNQEDENQLQKYQFFEKTSEKLEKIQHQINEYFQKKYRNFSTKAFYRVTQQKRKEDIYTLLLVIYYYYLKQRLIKKFEYESIDNLQSELLKIKQIYADFYLEFYKELRYLLKKQHQLKIIADQATTASLIKSINTKDLNPKVRIGLSQILRYLIKNGYEHSVQDLTNIADVSDIRQIKQSIYHSMLFLKDIKPQAKKYLDNVIENQSDIKTNNFLIQQRIRNEINKNMRIDREYKIENYHRISAFRTIQNNSYKNKLKINKVQSRKNYQTIKMMEKKINKNKQKQDNKDIMVSHDKIYTKQKEGNDRSWTRGTFEQIKNLYEIVSRDGLLKKGDKDEYLMQKFINEDNKHRSKGELGSFLIDRAIARIYRIISKKQRLTLETITNIAAKCVKHSFQFRCSKYSKYTNWEKLINTFIKQMENDKNMYIFNEDKEQPINSFMIQLRNKQNGPSQKQQILFKEIDAIRVDGIIALNNAICHLELTKILSKLLCNPLYQYLRIIPTIDKHQDSQFFYYFIEICLKCERIFDEQQKDWKNLLFNQCIHQLQFQKSKEKSLQHIAKQTEKTDNHEQIFKGRQIEAIIICIIKQQDINYLKIMMRVLIAYRSFSKSNPIQNNILMNIKLNKYFKQIKSQFYTVLYWNTIKIQKEETLANIIDQLTAEFVSYSKELKEQQGQQQQKRDQQIKYIILLIFYNISKMICITKINHFSFMLKDRTNVYIEENHFLFQKQKGRDEQTIDISFITAQIIYQSVRKPQKENAIQTLENSTVQTMFNQLAQDNMQTNIVISQILEEYSRKYPQKSNYLDNLEQYWNVQVFDIKLNLTKAYINISKYEMAHNAQTYDPNNLHNIFLFQDVQFEENEVSAKINQDIVTILFDYVNNKEFKEITQTRNFNIIEYYMNKCSKDTFEMGQKCGQFLINYSKKYFIPKNTLASLDKLIQRMKIKHISQIKEKIYKNLVQNEAEIQLSEVKMWIDQLKSCQQQQFEEGKKIFNILSKISQNQDLPDQMFNTIEVQRCCKISEESEANKDKIQQRIVQLTSKGIQLNPYIHFSEKIKKVNIEEINITKILYYLSQNQQKIPIKTLDRLLTIYSPTKRQNLQINKFIATTVVNTLLNYPFDNIQSISNLYLSIHQDELLEIALPIVLKQNFDKSNSISQTLIKLAEFFTKTNNLAHKLAISQLFLNDKYLKIIMKRKFDFDKFKPQETYGKQLKQNCNLIRYRASPSRRENQRNQIKFENKKNQPDIKQEISWQKRILRIQKHQKQQPNQSHQYSKILLKLLDQTISKTDQEKHQKQQTYQNIGIRRDYLYTIKQIILIFEEFKKIPKDNYKQNMFLELIITISKVHWNYIYESVLLQKQLFTDLIEKQLSKGNMKIQYLQIYSKMIAKQKCKNIQKIFSNVILCLCKEQSSEVIFHLLAILDRIFSNAKQNLQELMKKEQIDQLRVILQNNLSNKSRKHRYLAVKCFRILIQRQILEQTQAWTNLKTKIFNKFANLFRPKYIQDVIQNFAIMEVKQSISKNQNIEDRILSLIRLNFIFEIAVDESKRTKFNIGLTKIMSLTAEYPLKIQALTQIYLNFHKKQQDKRMDFFLKLLKCNSNMKEVIDNIKYHSFDQQKLAKIVIDSHIEKILQISVIQPQKILHICYHEDNQNTLKFLDKLALIVKKDKDKDYADKLIQNLHQQKTSLKNLFKDSQEITLNNILCSRLINLIQSLKFTFSSPQQQKQVKKLLILLLKKYTYQKSKAMIQYFHQHHQKFNFTLLSQYLIQLLHLIVRYPQQIQISTLTLNQIQLEKQRTKGYQYFIEILNKKIISLNKKVNQNLHEKIQEYRIEDQKLIQQKVGHGLLQRRLTLINNYSFKDSKLPGKINAPEILSNWKSNDFKKWSKYVKENQQYSRSHNFDIEALSIIKQAIYKKIKSKFYLRDNQLLSCLKMLQKNNQDIQLKQSRINIVQKYLRGRLSQIATGQGKSAIICAVAIILALKNHKVDVVTSTSILAKRDVDELSSIYKQFQIPVADNIDRQPYLKGPKQCYKCDVVYGQISQFQFDYLRDSYSELETRGGRGFDYVIVDEVDSMLIDDSTKIAKISSNIAGMDKLEIIYLLIWEKLLKIKQKIITFQEKTYYFEGRLEQHQDSYSFYYRNKEKQEQIRIADIEKYLYDVNENGQILIEKIKIMDSYSETIKLLLLKLKQEVLNNNKIHIPSNFKQFVEIQFPEWINSALLAYEYQQNIHYIIENSSPSPVDYDSTGKIQHSTNWANGLHQFIQLKHYLKLTPENLTTNFVSNIKYFQIYKSLLGVTGTLGSDYCRKTLAQTYKSDIIIIPNSYEKKLIKYDLTQSENCNQWVKDIKINVKYELNKNRGILIICETIEFCNFLASQLSDLNSNGIKLYTMNEKDQENDVQVIKSKEIIIATNLAGRGTDINTESIQQCGGLHVIITFLPKNLRVEDQAIGRTARSGNNGSSHIIINKMQLTSQFQNHSSEDALFQKRNQLEKQKLVYFIQSQKKQIQNRDQMFSCFCQFKAQLIKKLKKRLETRIKSKSKSEQLFTIQKTNNQDNFILQNIMSGVEQRWAFFLHKFIKDNNKQDYQRWQKQIQNDVLQQKVIQNPSKIIKNPYYFTLIGYDLLNSKQIKKKIKNAIGFNDEQDLSTAFTQFKNALNLDSNIIAAYVGKAEVLLKLQNNTLEFLKQNHNEQIQLQLPQHKKAEQQDDMIYKELALSYFKKALTLLKRQLQTLKYFISYSQQSQHQNNSLGEQTFQKYQIISKYEANITQISNEIRKSKKLVTISVKQAGDEGKITYYKEIQRKACLLQKIIDDKNKNDEETYLKMQFHNLNSNLTDHSGSIFKYLNKQKNILKDRDYINIQVKNLNANDINHITLDSCHKPNMRTQEAKKFVEDHQKDPLFQPTFMITSQKKKSTLKYKRQETIHFLQSDQYSNDVYNITALNTKEIKRLFTKNAKLVIKAFNISCEDFKILKQAKIICEYYQIELSAINLQPKHIEIFLKQNNNQQDLIWTQNNVPCDFNIGQNDGFMMVSNHRHRYKNNVSTLKNVNKIIFKVNNIQKVEKILNQFSDKFFDIYFHDCSQMESLKNVDHIVFSLYFTRIQPQEQQRKAQTAQSILQELKQSKKDCSFDIIIKRLENDNQFKKLIQCKIATQHVQIKGKKQLCQLFQTSNIPIHQIYEYSQQGIQYILQASQRKSIPRRVIFGLLIIASLQFILGTCLIPTGIGAIFGLSLVFQALGDYLTAAFVAKTREFKLKIYILMKIASMASMGYFGFHNIIAAGANILSTLKTPTIKFIGEIMPRILLATSKAPLTKLSAGQITKIKYHHYHGSSKDLGDFQLKKNIQQVISQLVQEFIQGNINLQEILIKMCVLDCMGESNLWSKKIERTVRSTVYNQCKQTEDNIEKFVVILSKIIMQKDKNNAEQVLAIKNSKILQQIIKDKFQSLKIKHYQIESSSLQTQKLLRKYSDPNHKLTAIDKQLKDKAAIIQFIDINGKRQSYKYVNLMGINHKLEEISPPFRGFLQKFQKIYKNIDKRQYAQKVTKSLATQLSDLLIEKILEQMASSLLSKDNKSNDSQANFKFLKESRCKFRENVDRFKNDILQKNQQLEQRLINNINFHQSKRQYAEFARIKYATPVDIMILLEEYGLEVKLINQTELQTYNAKKNEKIIIYQKVKVQNYESFLFRLNIAQIQQNKTNLKDTGFNEICYLMKMEITPYKVRKMYSNIILKKSQIFLQRLRSYYQIHSKVSAIILNNVIQKPKAKRYISFKALLSQYNRCSLLKEIERVQQQTKCINEHITIQNDANGLEYGDIALISLKYTEEHIQKISNLILFIIEKNVEASFVDRNRNRLQVRQQNLHLINETNHIEIKIVINSVNAEQE